MVTISLETLPCLDPTLHTLCWINHLLQLFMLQAHKSHLKVDSKQPLLPMSRHECCGILKFQSAIVHHLYSVSPKFQDMGKLLTILLSECQSGSHLIPQSRPHSHLSPPEPALSCLCLFVSRSSAWTPPCTVLTGLCWPLAGIFQDFQVPLANQFPTLENHVASLNLSPEPSLPTSFLYWLFLSVVTEKMAESTWGRKLLFWLPVSEGQSMVIWHCVPGQNIVAVGTCAEGCFSLLVIRQQREKHYGRIQTRFLPETCHKGTTSSKYYPLPTFPRMPSWVQHSLYQMPHNLISLGMVSHTSKVYSSLLGIP